MTARLPGERRALATLAGALALASLASCAGSLGESAHEGVAGPQPDSITVGLWHFDEVGGTRVADAGPFRLDGVAGVDTRTEFGRVRGARRFAPTVESFVFVPYNPVMEHGDGLTVEAWIYLNAYGQYEDTPIACRWTPILNQQSWIFSVVGQRLSVPVVPTNSPGYHNNLVQGGDTGQLLFAFQPGPASPPTAYTSTSAIALGRWTHVGVTFDGTILRFYIDGLPDAMYAAAGPIRSTQAPLVMGNFLDPTQLTDFGGELRLSPLVDSTPYYALDGDIDELRISSAARSRVTPRR